MNLHIWLALSTLLAASLSFPNKSWKQKKSTPDHFEQKRKTKVNQTMWGSISQHHWNPWSGFCGGHALAHVNLYFNVIDFFFFLFRRKSTKAIWESYLELLHTAGEVDLSRGSLILRDSKLGLGLETQQGRDRMTKGEQLYLSFQWNGIERLADFVKVCVLSEQAARFQTSAQALCIFFLSKCVQEITLMWCWRRHETSWTRGGQVPMLKENEGWKLLIWKCSNGWPDQRCDGGRQHCTRAP